MIRNNVPAINNIPIGNTIHAFLTKPAIIYVTKETAAAIIAYGSCVDTWFTWSHCAPALAIMVVSEIGEQWSPQTAPAIHADIEIMRSGAEAGKTAMQIGIRMPKVLHEVPVANAKKAATTKIIAGNSCRSPVALLATIPDTYSAAPVNRSCFSVSTPMSR